MASIQPFQPFVYSEEFLPHIDELIAPPYDVISPELLVRLHQLNPYNITHLTLPEGESTDKYQVAGDLLNQWIEKGILVRREVPAFYVYTQDFTHPQTDQRITRQGFVVALKLESFESGNVLPHERTLSGPREDRLRLMEKTHANLEPIFGMYADESGESLRVLQEVTENTPHFIKADDSAYTTHTVWEVTDGRIIEQLKEQLQSNPVFIVDGHHRYKTACDYRDKYREEHPDLPENHPVDTIMIYLSPMSDPGLVILPTHRIIHSLPTFDFDQMLERISDLFDLIPCERGETGFRTLRQMDDGIAFLLMSPANSVVAVLKKDRKNDVINRSHIPEVLAGLDVSILHSFLLEEILGISTEAQENQSNLRYAKSVKDAIHALHEPDAQMVIGMNATRFDQVQQVALASEVMPQKSTYFYPKLASGLLLHRLS